MPGRCECHGLFVGALGSGVRGFGILGTQSYGSDVSSQQDQGRSTVPTSAVTWRTDKLLLESRLFHQPVEPASRNLTTCEVQVLMRFFSAWCQKVASRQEKLLRRSSKDESSAVSEISELGQVVFDVCQCLLSGCRVCSVGTSPKLSTPVPCMDLRGVLEQSCPSYVQRSFMPCPGHPFHM